MAALGPREEAFDECLQPVKVERLADVGIGTGTQELVFGLAAHQHDDDVRRLRISLKKTAGFIAPQP